jgi:hypothetical protein
VIDVRTATPEELATIEPADFVEGVKGLSGRELETLMAGPSRTAILGSIFMGMPRLFRPDVAGSATATTHWSITGQPGDGSDDWTVRVADGVCTVVRGHEGEPALGLTLGPVDFIKLITRTGNPVMMVMTGRLRTTGDLSLGARIASWFAVPTP